MSKRTVHRLDGELVKPSWRGEALKDLHTRLRVRYPEKEYALFHEVRNETGFASQPRYADAIVMGLWPSRGLQLEGFECKVDRSDWLNELRNPAKAEAIATYCDLWWLVTPNDPSVANLNEIPPTWGWLVPHGKAFKVAKEAVTNKSVVPIDRAFLASVFRAAQSEATVSSRIDVMRDAMRRELNDRIEAHERYSARELKELRESIQKFEKASGLSINRWDGERIGAQVRALEELKGRGENVSRLVESAIERVERDRDTLKNVLATLKPDVDRKSGVA